MSVTTFLLLTACLLIAAKCAGWIFQRLRLPTVLGQLLVGVLVGPSLLGWVHTEPIMDAFANLGVIILMFMAGLETDMKQMRQVGGAAFISASMGVIIPFVAGTLFAFALGYTWPVSFFLGTLLTATSVSISAQTLKDLGKLTTKAGTTILGAAVIDDVLGLIVLSLILAFTLGQNPTWAIVKMVLYFPIAYVLGHYGFPLLSRLLPKMLALEARIGMVLALVLLYAWSAESLGNVAAITGAYIAGILVSRTEMREWVHDGMSKIGMALFIPLFFVYVGIEANFHSVGNMPLLPLVGFIGIAIATKVLGCGSGAWLSRFSPLDSLTVGVGMISRGEVALITATIGLQARLITPELFSVVILISLVTTLITPLLLKLVYLIPATEKRLAVASEAHAHAVSEAHVHAHTHTMAEPLFEFVESELEFIESVLEPEEVEVQYVQEEHHHHVR
ncbi:MAG TPA: cation:proton antiporter [Ktedonobacteraceae bacterium]|jgi:Kef-type K+ transport system membrane component KefB|nr:cation:proton antiporter [Ktedonobacteraceae bacterium]